MVRPRIILVEDDPDISLTLSDDLEMEGYDIEAVSSGEEGYRQAKSGRFQAMILDLMLPDINGLDVCRRLRREGETLPILILTARREEADKLIGFELGADDYVTKPFSRTVLLARLKALLRMASRYRSAPDKFITASIRIDFNRCEAYRDGKRVHLTALEFNLLRFLASNEGEAVSRDRILDTLWGTEVFVSPRTVDTHIANLRKKLEKDPARPGLLVGLRGIGYKLVNPDRDKKGTE